MNAKLPRLESKVESGRLRLQWQVADGTVFPLPIEVNVNGKLHRVNMDAGKGGDYLLLPRQLSRLIPV